MKKSKGDFRRFLVLGFLVGIIVLVSATAPSWVGSTINYTTLEDASYYHNLSANITGFDNDVTFAIDTLLNNITWENASGTFSVSESTVSDWIGIYNSALGNLTLNATHNNQTGFFTIPIQAKNLTSNESSTTIFEFIINATNDAPNYTATINDTYNLTQDITFGDILNAIDEEAQYPLGFNLTFLDTCTHASFTGRNTGENCSIFNLTAIGNTSAEMNFTPVRNDVGTYYAEISVYDNGENDVCPHPYCVNATYAQNKTSDTTSVTFNVFANLAVNVSDCDGAILNESEEFTCEINITTRQINDTVNISTYAFFNNWAGPYDETNRDWFYANTTNTSANFSFAVPINITPEKLEVGNWTINFSVYDPLQDSTVVSPIQIFVNWTEANATFSTLPNFTVYSNQSIEINATDLDLIIYDKSIKNESLTFASNTSWVTFVNTTTLSGSNYTTVAFDVDFDTALLQGETNHTILVNVTDGTPGTSFDSEVFTIEILNDTAAEWNTSIGISNVSNEGTEVYINLSQFVSDVDGDTITFSYENSTGFDNFNLTSSGIINFTSDDEDVGFHNITLNASDGKLDSLYYFNFTILNVVDSPVIEALAAEIAGVEDTNQEIDLNIRDNDLAIPVFQSEYYSENLTVNTTIVNLTSVTTVIDFDFVYDSNITNLSVFKANFTPLEAHVGDYNISITVTDGGNQTDSTSFILNVTSVNDAPVLDSISNQTARVTEEFYLDINATDSEDDLANISLTYVLTNLTAEGNFLTINSSTGVINFSLNTTYAGRWNYNVSVNDSSGEEDSELFTLEIFGTPNITLPESGYIFNWTEGTATGNLVFEVNYSVNNTNLTYLFYMDHVNFYNESNLSQFNYTTLISNTSLRNETNHSWNLESNFTWNFTPSFSDETYGELKNLTLLVYNQVYPDLNDSVNWGVNISHANQNVSFDTNISDQGPTSYSDTITINLSEHFTDVDFFDIKTNQTVNFTLNSSSPGFIVAGSSFSSDWILSLDSPTETSENLTVTANEYNSSNDLIRSVTSNEFEVEFIAPSTTTTTSSGGGGGGGGGGSSLKYFSLKIVVPQDVVIVQDDFIDVFFSVQNIGSTALSGINLSSIVTHDSLGQEEVTISLLGGNYISSLPIGTSQNFSMRISADTNAGGQYKATIFANVTSPKFGDSADFFITLSKTNSSEEGQLLIFTEKLVAENPECLELTELINEARNAFDLNQLPEAYELTTQVVEACEAALESQEQIRYSGSFFEKNLSIILVFTLFVFILGIGLYVYKRVRFNKSKLDTN